MPQPGYFCFRPGDSSRAGADETELREETSDPAKLKEAERCSFSKRAGAQPVLKGAPCIVPLSAHRKPTSRRDQIRALFAARGPPTKSISRRASEGQGQGVKGGTCKSAVSLKILPARSSQQGSRSRGTCQRHPLKGREDQPLKQRQGRASPLIRSTRRMWRAAPIPKANTTSDQNSQRPVPIRVQASPRHVWGNVHRQQSVSVPRFRCSSLCKTKATEARAL